MVTAEESRDTEQARAIALETARQAVADEWRAQAPETPEQIAAFYRTVQGYGGELAAWHETEGRKQLTQIVIAALHACKARSVLDVGCGLGYDLAALHAEDPSLTLVGVEPNEIMRASISPAIATVMPSIDAVSGIYDMAICMDVLEHVPDPDALLERVIARLRIDGGVLVEHTPTHDTDTPLHLPSLRGWHPGRLLDANGFKLQEDLEGLRIWRRESVERIHRDHLLLCAYRAMSVATVLSLTKLVENGWRFSVHQGDALISRVRSVAVSQWYKQTAGDVFLMVDDDIVFDIDDAEKVVALAREKRSIASAAYPVRDGSHLASASLVDGEEIAFGPGQPPKEIRWAGTGFIAVHRDVVEALIKTLPLTMVTTPWSFWPMFMPFVYGDGVEANYLSEDWAMCERARKLGFRVWLDPSIELKHIGSFEYRVRNMQSVEIEAPPTDYLGA